MFENFNDKSTITKPKTRTDQYVNIHVEWSKARTWFQNRINKKEPYKDRLPEYHKLEQKVDSIWSMLSQSQKVEAMDELIEKGLIPKEAKKYLIESNGTLETLKGD